MPTDWLPRYRRPSLGMQELDRLDWAAGMSVFAYGQRIGIRANDQSVLPQIEERLPPGWEPGCSPFVDRLYSIRSSNASASGSRKLHVIYAGLTRIARTFDWEEALDALESDLQTHIAQNAANRVFLHAGAVGWRGQALVIPGGSFSGKSTLVAALLRLGASYYSDEYAVLDGRGQVHPFARRISLRRGPADSLLRPSAAGLGATAGQLSLPVGMLALCDYQPNARWAPRHLSADAAVTALLSHTFTAQRDPEMALYALRQAIASSVAIDIKRGEAEPAAEALLSYFDGLQGHSSENQRAA